MITQPRFRRNTVRSPNLSFLPEMMVSRVVGYHTSASRKFIGWARWWWYGLLLDVEPLLVYKFPSRLFESSPRTSLHFPPPCHLLPNARKALQHSDSVTRGDRVTYRLSDLWFCSLEPCARDRRSAAISFGDSKQNISLDESPTTSHLQLARYVCFINFTLHINPAAMILGGNLFCDSG